MGWLLAGATAALSGLNAAMFAANGEPVSIGAAVFSGLACLAIAIGEAGNG